ncbi:hypothetical protein SAMN04489712_111102 [Thermomonospora echinospora]|uniref:tRNA-guanine family transglycosylase n=1 Tax=Thermomonospora echinospora TaxID=1992 RepID=A0A1H6CT39_9ACTN|nr:hypothetical protein [Thermomonospora echinospora]SEG75957.1 hypothetical protein SAMN04489712_111102 [Thermomonospora echinospora]
MNDRTTAQPRSASGSLLSSSDAQGTAARAVAQRILVLERARLLRESPDYLDPDHGGLVLCGRDCSARLRELAGTFTGVLAEDCAAYEREVATPDAPFSLPEGVLFGGDLDSALQEQLDRGATFAIAPTRYVRAGDSASLKAVMKTVNELERDDVVVPLPVSISWLRTEGRTQLTAVIRAIRHPVALILGGQYDPLQQFAKAPENLRGLLADVPGTGLWRTDLAGFDALAHGGGFAAIGAGGSVRHLVPAGERAESSGGGPNYPSVLVPELLRFSTAKFLADAYANTTPPRCHCARCDGRYLDAFFDRTDAAKAAAHAHNSATWNSWLPDFLEQPTLTDRQRWWQGRCKLAVDAHALENNRIGQPGKFKPSRPLEKWATLPISADTTTGA